MDQDTRRLRPDELFLDTLKLVFREDARSVTVLQRAATEGSSKLAEAGGLGNYFFCYNL